MLKKRKYMKNSGLFLNMENWCFLGLFISDFNGFCVSAIVAKVLKMLVFPPVLGLLWGGLFLFVWAWKV